MSISLTTRNIFVFINFPVVTEHVKEPGKSFVSSLARNQQSATSLCAEFSCEHSQICMFGSFQDLRQMHMTQNKLRMKPFPAKS